MGDREFLFLDKPSIDMDPVACSEMRNDISDKVSQDVLNMGLKLVVF